MRAGADLGARYRVRMVVPSRCMFALLCVVPF